MDETSNSSRERKDTMNKKLDFSEAPPIPEKPVQPKQEPNPTTASNEEEKILDIDSTTSTKGHAISEAYKELTKAANPKNQTPSDGVKTEGSNELQNLLSKEEYTHDYGDHQEQYLFTSPFLRIEKSGGVIRIVKRGIQDGEQDRVVSHLLIENGNLVVIGEVKPLPLDERSKNNPLIKYLLKTGVIIEEAISEEDSDAAYAVIAGAAYADARAAAAGAAAAAAAAVRLKDIKVDHNVLQVLQGQYKSDKDGKKIMTLGLANCVAVTIYDPITKTGALAHFDPAQESGHMFGNMISGFNQKNYDQLQIRLVGGWSGNSERVVHYLRQQIASRGLEITSEDVLGDNISRCIVLDTANGNLTYIQAN